MAAYLRNNQAQELEIYANTEYDEECRYQLDPTNSKISRKMLLKNAESQDSIYENTRIPAENIDINELQKNSEQQDDVYENVNYTATSEDEGHCKTPAKRMISEILLPEVLPEKVDARHRKWNLFLVVSNTITLLMLLSAAIFIVVSYTLPGKNWCESNPCKNGGNCTNHMDMFTCECPTGSGYTGELCEIGVNACLSNPCHCRGNCTDLVAGYRCDCDPGFTGDRCQTELNECSSQPCRNNGKCLDKINGYVCNCRPGFMGDRCENNVDECSSNPCNGRGVCVDRVNGFTCRCKAGYVGDRCETDVNECSSSPCSSPRMCIDKVNGYICDTCNCQRGYTGDTCNKNVNNVRLVGGCSKREGRIEIRKPGGPWGTVCDDSFVKNAGDMFCRMLGFSGGSEQVYAATQFGPGTGPIHLDELTCASGATSWDGCTHSGWGVHDCSHPEDAGVRCK